MSVKKKSSFQLHGEIVDLLGEYPSEDANGVVDETEHAEWHAKLQALVERSEDKMLSLRFAKDRVEQEEAFLKGQAAIYTRAANARKKDLARIKGMAVSLMQARYEATGEKGLKLSDGRSVSISHKQTPKTVVTDLAAVPEELLKPRAVNKDEVLRRLKAGEQVPGCELGHTESTSVTFR